MHACILHHLVLSDADTGPRVILQLLHKTVNTWFWHAMAIPFFCVSEKLSIMPMHAFSCRHRIQMSYECPRSAVVHPVDSAAEVETGTESRLLYMPQPYDTLVACLVGFRSKAIGYFLSVHLPRTLILCTWYTVCSLNRVLP